MQVVDPVRDEKFFLTEERLQELEKETGKLFHMATQKVERRVANEFCKWAGRARVVPTLVVSSMAVILQTFLQSVIESLLIY
jgi:hypothetical protein